MNKDDTHNVSLGTLYDFNKQIMLKQSKLSKSKLKAIEPKLEDWYNWQIEDMPCCFAEKDMILLYFIYMKNRI